MMKLRFFSQWGLFLFLYQGYRYKYVYRCVRVLVAQEQEGQFC